MEESIMEDDGEIHYPFSRCSSTGSINAMNSSANTTDDEDSDLGAQMTIKDRRRELHTQAEQKRRDAIKKGYDLLQELVPMGQNSDTAQSFKVSKATVLQKSVDYINFIQNAKKKQEDEVSVLKREVVAMTIMKLNYDQIVSAHQNQPGNLSRQVSDDMKFEVFRAVIDSLFQTFDLSVGMNNFAEVSGSVIQWVEEHCKPQILREVMCGVLRQLQQHEYATSPASNQNLTTNPPPPSLASPIPSNILAPGNTSSCCNVSVPGSNENAAATSVLNTQPTVNIAAMHSMPVCSSNPILNVSSECNIGATPGQYSSGGRSVSRHRSLSGPGPFN